MDSLPEPLDMQGIRRAARELHTRAVAGDRIASERVRRAHPRFGWNRPSSSGLIALTLGDARLCIAREHGFENWADLVAYGQGVRGIERPWRHWGQSPDARIAARAEQVSQDLGHRHIGPEHALGALLSVEEPTIASRVLASVGLTWERWKAAYGRSVEGRPHRRYNPAWYRLVGIAEGLALAEGAERLTDEHVLIALCYGRNSRVPDILVSFDVNPDAVLRALAEAGAAIPALLPPPPASSMLPRGPRVYFPSHEFGSVTGELNRRFPPVGLFWGWNTDGEGRYWVDGDADIDLPTVVRSIVRDPDAVEVEIQ
ncbi:MAG: Clp protease N-terminal domain-containing protein [Mycobacterium sp.]